MRIHIPGTIACLSFDLWLTLIKPSPKSKTSRTRILGDFFGVSADDILANLASMVNAELDRQSEQTGLNYTCADRVALLAQKLGREVPDEVVVAEVVRAIQDSVVKYCPHLINPETPRILSNLRDWGFRLVSISNTGFPESSAMNRVLDELGIGSLLSARLFSNDAGIAKPNPDFFGKICEQMGVDRSRVLHIGDSLAADYHGARNVGFEALWFNGQGISSDLPNIASLSQLTQ